MSPIGTHYLATWREVTAEHDNVRFMASLAGDLASAARAFGDLAERLASDTGEATERVDDFATGANELAASIREISASTSAAAASICWPSTPRSRRPRPASRATGSPSSPARSRPWPGGRASPPARSPR